MQREAEVLKQEHELQALRRNLALQEAQEQAKLQAEIDRVQGGRRSSAAAAGDARAQLVSRPPSVPEGIAPQRLIRTPLEQDHDILAPGPFDIKHVSITVTGPHILTQHAGVCYLL